MKKGYTSGLVEKQKKHIFDLLSSRYSNALEDAVGTRALIYHLDDRPEVRYSESAVDRAVWPQGFIAAVDDRVKFN